MKDIGAIDEKMGFRPQKHNFSVLGVKYPLFKPEISFGGVKSHNKSIQNERCRCH